MLPARALATGAAAVTAETLVTSGMTSSPEVTRRADATDLMRHARYEVDHPLGGPDVPGADTATSTASLALGIAQQDLAERAHADSETGRNRFRPARPGVLPELRD